jgi:hypothetical protein
VSKKQKCSPIRLSHFDIKKVLEAAIEKTILAKTKRASAIEERVNRIKVTSFRPFVPRPSACDTVFFQFCSSLYLLGFFPFQLSASLYFLGFSPFQLLKSIDSIFPRVSQHLLCVQTE